MDDKDDVLGYFDKLSEQDKQKKETLKAARAAEAQERMDRNSKLNAKLNSVVSPRIHEVMRALSKRDDGKSVALKIDTTTTIVGEKPTSIAFYLEKPSLGAGLPTRYRTATYVISLQEDGNVEVTQRFPGRQGLTAPKPVDLRNSIGRTTTDQLDDAYVNRVIKAAMDEFFSS